MGKSRKPTEPRTFFLNETHELGRGKNSGGGRPTVFASIDWSSKGRDLNKSLGDAAKKIDRSNDPLRQKRLFFLAAPEEKIEKVTKAKSHPNGVIEEETDFAAGHARTFSRLGIDLIEVTSDGDAVVHATPEKFQNLLTRTDVLGDLGAQEQARWARVREFDTIPPRLRVDNFWISKVKANEEADVIVEFQPILTRQEVELMFRAIAGLISDSDREKLVANGKDLSGRSWLRGSLSKKTINKIAKDFFSVQSLHEPIYSIAAGKSKSKKKLRNKPVLKPVEQIDLDSFPTVAVFDDGVPAEHQYLEKYRRGEYSAIANRAGSHGSKVASRIVFGERDFSDGLDGVESLRGDCRFVDVNVAGLNGTIHEKSVTEALPVIPRVYRDTRVFNFSFSSSALTDPSEAVKQREQLLTTQDLDNFIFENDVIVAVCTGNSPPGIVPNSPYPKHIDDPNWKIGHWASGFNTIVTGAFVDRLTPDSIVQQVGWPSPFTKVGPGLLGGAIPHFSAPGGSRGMNHRYRPGLGVSVCDEFGRWEDASGTSFAVPITARQAAFTLLELDRYCKGDTRPFGVTAKAFLTLTSAHELHIDEENDDFFARTLGRGRASSQRLQRPVSSSAVFLWQGIIENPNDKVQVQFPIPLDWYKEASEPVLRLICAADVPVNEGIKGLWACRTINCKLRSSPNGKAFSTKKSKFNKSNYPIFERLYELKRPPKGCDEIDDDIWIFETTYSEIGDYPAGQLFSPQQRVAIAAELFDKAESPLSPQQFVQSLPICTTMNYLSVSSEIQLPVIIRQ